MLIIVGEVVPFGDLTDVRVVLCLQQLDCRLRGGTTGRKLGVGIPGRIGDAVGVSGSGALTFPLGALGGRFGCSCLSSDPGSAMFAIDKAF
jgi:hypothetical protein